MSLLTKIYAVCKYTYFRLLGMVLKELWNTPTETILVDMLHIFYGKTVVHIVFCIEDAQ